MRSFWKRLIPWSAALSLCLLPGLSGASEDVQALYAQKCAMCHSIGGEGGAMAALGGALDATGSKRDAEWLRAYLSDPKSKLEGAKMPKLPLGDEQLDGLVTYMLTLTGAPPAE